MLRRPPGEGRLVAERQRSAKVFMLLGAFLLSPWLPIADAQPQHSLRQPAVNVLKYQEGDNELHNHRPARRHESPFDGQSVIEKPVVISGRKSTHSGSGNYAVVTTVSSSATETNRNEKKKRTINAQNYNNNDVGAVQTVAPGGISPVGAPVSPEVPASKLGGAGLSQHFARSLRDWEVEDYVLLATIDGHLFAVDRNTGEQRWKNDIVDPTVETIHHRPNNSLPDNEESMYGLVWAVEPTQDGPIYVWSPSNPSMQSGVLKFATIKELVDGPSARHDLGLVYVGEKKTMFYTINAANGMAAAHFGVEDGERFSNCSVPQEFPESTQECVNDGAITISRTTYTVSVRSQRTGRPLVTLKYREWGTNLADRDLYDQYQEAENNRYFTTGDDGILHVYRESPYSNDNAASRRPDIEPLSFSTPVARVFDIARPKHLPKGSNPELLILPQPPPPVRNDGSRAEGVVLNRTESGSWYAMSGLSYPLMTEVSAADICREVKVNLGSDCVFNENCVKKLIGKHILLQSQQAMDNAGRQSSLPSDGNSYLGLPASAPDTIDGSLAPKEDGSEQNVLDLFQKSTHDYTRAFFVNPVFAVAVLLAAVFYLTGLWRANTKQSVEHGLVSTHPEPLDHNHHDIDPAIAKDVPLEEAPKPGSDSESHKTVQIDEGVSEPLVLEPMPPPEPQVESPEKKDKKPRKRGTRGGQKHKKNKQKEQSQSNDDNRQGPHNGSQQQIDNIMKNAGQRDQGLQPNVRTLPGDPEEISTGFEINGLQVNTDEQLGMGSNGTVVFSGKFHQRPVAVKRMLNDFYDIASKETELLLESDAHQNVIQYYALIHDQTFLYIALERCDASLADIVDKPHMHKTVAEAGRRDIPNVLLQIASGLRHLHNLRIVHRDLKPQNILVTVTKDGQPRLVVSDFGLCKKLDGAQSSFGATTAHAAGTSGWRAPELLLDDDNRESTNSVASSHSDSSQLISADVMPNRRATRAIDIFSLGLVFFYVLTGGLHPFDCGDRYMREVNIRKGEMNLQPLDVLGDIAYEAKDLIRSMLAAKPQDRPPIDDVMAHPFFWDPKKRLAFLCDVSDHFEKEPRDPMSQPLEMLEDYAFEVTRGDFLKPLTKEFVESLGKQRKYTGSRLLDLLRALRNKWNHREDMTDSLKKSVGITHEAYLNYWTRIDRFPNLLLICYYVIWDLRLTDAVRFREYFEPMKP